MAIADASVGPPDADELEPDEPPPKEPPEPKGNPPELPDPADGSEVDGCELEPDRQAARPTPNPAAMAITTNIATAVAAHALRAACCASGPRCGAEDAPQYCPGG